MTLCAVTKTEPAGDDLQSTALRSTDDDDNSNDDDDDNKWTRLRDLIDGSHKKDVFDNFISLQCKFKGSLKKNDFEL